MHIPDGYLSPETCAAAWAAAVPTLAVATRRVGTQLRTRQVPTLAMFSAASFLVMMFNLPVPGGTTAHAVGAVVIAVVLGPWPAMVAVSVALLLQALVFGDGGVLAWGANVLNMAVIMPVVGLAVYRLLAGSSPLTSRRRTLAAAAGGYVGILVASLAVAVELGVQPLLFHTASGTPLYAPYPLSQTVPAMALAHLLVAGPAEAVLTGAVLHHVARTNPALLARTHPQADLAAQGVGTVRPGTSPARRRPRLTPGRTAIAVIAVVIALTPLGLLASGGAFGEDAPGDLDLGALGLSAVPQGMARYAQFWNHTLLADYGWADGAHPVQAYYVSALLGTLVVGGVVYAAARLGQVLSRRRAARGGAA